VHPQGNFPSATLGVVSHLADANVERMTSLRTDPSQRDPKQASKKTDSIRYSHDL
jgi:hypothetical protein